MFIKYVYICFGTNVCMTEFGLQTIRHLCPCVRYSLAVLGFCSRGLSAFTSLKRYVSQGLYSFFVQNRCSRSGAAHMYSPATGSDLGALGFKSLQLYNRFCVHFLKLFLTHKRFSNTVLGTRFRIEHRCNVCAQLALLP